MRESIAERVVEMVVGRRPGALRALSAGRSSDAYAADVGGQDWIVRIPTNDPSRRTSYHVEATVGDYLASAGHPVAQWSVLELEGVRCSIARRLAGSRVDYTSTWPTDFAKQLGHLLDTLHNAPVKGFGPLMDNPSGLRGSSADRTSGIIERWCHAPIWPFDGTPLGAHPINAHAPDLIPKIAKLLPRIVDAERSAIGLTHSDLHREHILRHDNGRLAGVLDFGAAFLGASAWDFALLAWYYGRTNTRLVADHYDNGNDAYQRGLVLAVAVGMYKLAKNPADPAVLPRLQRCVEAVSAT